MPRRFITFTDEFDKAVADYQRRHNLSSWSQAVVELAAKQLNFTEEAAPAWGGNRRETAMRNLSHVYTIQSGRSTTFILPDNGKWYALQEAWEGSRLLNTAIVAGPFDTPEEAQRAADEAREERSGF